MLRTRTVGCSFHRIRPRRSIRMRNRMASQPAHARTALRVQIPIRAQSRQATRHPTMTIATRAATRPSTSRQPRQRTVPNRSTLGRRCNSMLSLFSGCSRSGPLRPMSAGCMRHPLRRPRPRKTCSPSRRACAFDTAFDALTATACGRPSLARTHRAGRRWCLLDLCVAPGSKLTGLLRLGIAPHRTHTRRR